MARRPLQLWQVGVARDLGGWIGHLLTQCCCCDMVRKQISEAAGRTAGDGLSLHPAVAVSYVRGAMLMESASSIP